MPDVNQGQFDNMWGTEGDAPSVPDAPTRTLDPAAFSQKWLTAPAAAQPQNTSTPTSTANAALGGAIEGVPIIGPWLKSSAEKAAAGIRSVAYGTPYADELNNVQGYATQSAAAHPVANVAGQVTGAVAPMITGAAIAPTAFGMVGPLWQRALTGLGTNALINGADSAVRSNGDPQAAMRGAIIGGTAGAALPVAGKVLGTVGNALFGSSDPAVNALAQRANALGIPINFAQTSDSPFVQKLSQMAGKLPGSGMADIHDAQQTAFNRAVSNTFGEDASRLTPDIMAAAKKRIGSVFDDVAARTTINADQPFKDSLLAISRDAPQVLSDSEMAPLEKQLKNVAAKIDPDTGTISGDAYQALTKKNSPLDVAMNNKNSNISVYAHQIRDALDDALQRSTTPYYAKQLTHARSQYKAMKTVEDLVEKSPTGDISPAQLMTPVRQSYSNMAYGGGGNLADLARIGQRFMKAPADSGTPLGTAALNAIMSPAGLLTASALGGGAAYEAGVDPIEAAKYAAITLPATALAARGVTTLLNRPQVFNALLQRTPSFIPAVNQLAAPSR